MNNYVREQSIGEVLRNAAQIYGRNFGVMFLTYLLPVFPISVWQTEMQAGGKLVWFWVALICALVAAFVAWGAVVIAVSDICVGNKPSVERSYRKIFSGLLGRLALVGTLQTLVILIGLALCVVPGVIALLWFMFAPPVVMLEGLGGIQALKRSKQLAQGHLGRNFLVLLVTMIIGGVVGGLIGGIFGLLGMVQSFAYRLVLVAVQTLITPFSIIAMILLYYDLRVRKEAYDPRALAEDLRR